MRGFCLFGFIYTYYYLKSVFTFNMKKIDILSSFSKTLKSFHIRIFGNVTYYFAQCSTIFVIAFGDFFYNSKFLYAYTQTSATRPFALPSYKSGINICTHIHYTSYTIHMNAPVHLVCCHCCCCCCCDHPEEHNS